MDHLQALYWVCLAVRVAFWLWSLRPFRESQRKI